MSNKFYNAEAVTAAVQRMTGRPFVSGKRILLPYRRTRASKFEVLGTFSSHWAAVAALVRLHQPEFESLGGDKTIDLREEGDMHRRILLDEQQGRTA